MTIKDFISKAIEGGYDIHEKLIHLGCKRIDGYTITKDYVTVRTGSSTIRRFHFECFMLDPKAWEALGKVEGWNQEIFLPLSPVHTLGEKRPEWQFKMKWFVTHLIDGGTIESYLETL